MMKRVTTSIFAALALMFTTANICAYADPGPGNIDMDAGSLSSRFELLDNLGNSLTNEESVVIVTRVGVLVSVNRALNDNQVSFDGEAVGDIVRADDGHMWVNAMGAAKSVIGVYATNEQAALVNETGDYHTKGSTLKITGTYHIACPEHQGELDVHASNIEVTANGTPTTHRISSMRSQVALVFCFAAGIILVIFMLSRSYLKKRENR